MQRQTILLLLWTLTASVSCQGTVEKEKITVKTISDEIVVSCGTDKFITHESKTISNGKLKYEDDNTGEYTCDEQKIFVKFRKCENCVEFDVTSIAGLAVGNVLATIVVGVAVYLIASQNRISPNTSHKSSDRQPLVLNEGSSRAPNDHYQPLKPKGVNRDMYDVLNNTHRR